MNFNDPQYLQDFTRELERLSQNLSVNNIDTPVPTPTSTSDMQLPFTNNPLAPIKALFPSNKAVILASIVKFVLSPKQTLTAIAYAETSCRPFEPYPYTRQYNFPTSKEGFASGYSRIPGFGSVYSPNDMNCEKRDMFYRSTPCPIIMLPGGELTGDQCISLFRAGIENSLTGVGKFYSWENFIKAYNEYEEANGSTRRVDTNKPTTLYGGKIKPLETAGVIVAKHYLQLFKAKQN
jgi:hypothetical protein